MPLTFVCAKNGVITNRKISGKNLFFFIIKKTSSENLDEVSNIVF
jgi:hypothetical protein